MNSGKLLRCSAALVALTTCTFAFFHDPAPSGQGSDDLVLQAPLTQIDCQGLACNGSGGPNPRRWSYWVQPGTGGVNRVDIGIHYPMPWISQVVMPPGWSVQVLADSIADDMPFTAHGVVTAQTGPGCEWVVRWTGPTMFTAFQLGYSSGQGRHEVEWDTSDGSVANWASPVGNGRGPVHSPVFGIIPVSEEEHEGRGHQGE